MLRFVILQSVNNKVVIERSQEQVLMRLLHGVEEYLAGKDTISRVEILAAVSRTFNDIVREIKQETIRL